MTINCLGSLIDFTQPKIMGIINLTPDSFYEGSRINDEVTILNKIETFLKEGATFIDIGAVSSKPNADWVTEEEEKSRLLPILEQIIKNFPNVLLSIDTFRSVIAKEAVQRGAAVINDISAGTYDENMMLTLAKLQVPYCMMHIKGTPKTMMQNTHYDDILKEILFYFSEKIYQARSFGINDIIIDVGFGFAKTIEQNYFLLQKLAHFTALEVPILTGISRKSMIYKALNTNAENALNGTTALHMIALLNKSNILRVHDVKEAKECITLYQKYIETIDDGRAHY